MNLFTDGSPQPKDTRPSCGQNHNGAPLEPNFQPSKRRLKVPPISFPKLLILTKQLGGCPPLPHLPSPERGTGGVCDYISAHPIKEPVGNV